MQQCNSVVVGGCGNYDGGAWSTVVWLAQASRREINSSLAGAGRGLGLESVACYIAFIKNCIIMTRD